MSSPTFGGFLTSTQRIFTQGSMPEVPSQPHYRIISQEKVPPSQSRLNLNDPAAALLATGTSDMASVVSTTVQAVSDEFTAMEDSQISTVSGVKHTCAQTYGFALH